MPRQITSTDEQVNKQRPNGYNGSASCLGKVITLTLPSPVTVDPGSGPQRLQLREHRLERTLVRPDEGLRIRGPRERVE